MIDIFAQFLYLLILIGDHSFEIFGLILDTLDNIDNFADLVVLVPNKLLIVFKDLSVGELSSLVIFIVLSTLVDLLLSRSII